MTAFTLNLVRNPYSNKLRSGYAGGYAPAIGSGAVYHVAKTGNDTTGTGSAGNPFLTIGRAMSVAEVGMTIKVHANGGAMTTYRESTDPTDPLYGNPYTTKVNVSGSVVAGISPQVSGQLGNQCTLMVFEGDEGLVQIQGADLLAGIHTDGYDYWTIWGFRIIDCFKGGVVSYDTSTGSVPNKTIGGSVSIGWVVENCFFDNIYTDQISHSGIDNCSAISPWGSKDWVIRNNKIRRVYDVDGIKINSAIQSYYAVNCLIEHNDIESDQGIFFKDHWLETVFPRAPYALESEIRYNRIKTTGAPLYVGQRDSTTQESGGHYFHHNICFGTHLTTTGNSAKTFFYAKMQQTGGVQQSTTLRIENNILDKSATDTMTGVKVNAFNAVTFKGNILIANGTLYSLENAGDGNTFPLTKLVASDENIFVTPAFKMELQKNAPDEVAITSFATWKTKMSGDYRDLAVNTPDINSTVLASTTGMFNNIATNDYSYATGSTAIAFMQDGSNAGAYQLGTETIGLLPVYSAGS